jgi:hypothetical protein
VPIVGASNLDGAVDSNATGRVHEPRLAVLSDDDRRVVRHEVSREL